MIPKKLYVVSENPEELQDEDVYAAISLEYAMKDEDDGSTIAEYQLVRSGKIKSSRSVTWEKSTPKKPRTKKAK